MSTWAPALAPAAVAELVLQRSRPSSGKARRRSDSFSSSRLNTPTRRAPASKQRHTNTPPKGPVPP